MTAAGSATGRPSPGALAQFNGTGVSHWGQGDFTVGRDLIIGVQGRSDQDTKFLADLRSTDPGDDKRRIERTKGGLLRDSYRWILDHNDFRRWRDDAQSRLLWIKGDPGKGKTMLLCGIVDELEKLTSDTCTLSYFFCQATDVRLNNAKSVLRGLIYQLLVQKRSLITCIREKYDHTGKQLFEDVNSWDALTKMFIRILEEPTLQNTYLVIDALDECETDLDQLLHLIVQLSSTSRVKLIASSRNRHDIEQTMLPNESQMRMSLELKENAEFVSWAVNTYISHCVSTLPALQGDQSLQDQVRHKMQLKADGTFLWVALVVQELRKAQSWDVLDIIEEVPAGLDKLYGRMMQHIQHLRRRDPEFCRNVLSTVTTAYRPLHLDELQALAELPADTSNMRKCIVTIVALCSSFLTIRDDVVYLIHQSAKDYLILDRYLFPSGLAVRHDTIASRSIQVMSRTLRRDIYSLRTPGFPIEQVKRPEPDPLAPARYSCIYWVHHLAEGMSAGQQRGQGLQDGGPAHLFLEQRFLYWLEALSLLRSISAGILQMSKLVHLTQISIETPKMTKLARDGLRFIRAHRASIENNPLQTYASALIFSPRRSIVRKLFCHEEPTWILTKVGMEDEWDACLQTLEGHSSVVNSVAFSGDGTQLASASRDNTIKVWDRATGQCLQTLAGHRYIVSSVAFSGDGTQLASASYDNTIKVWDRDTGQCLQTLTGHSAEVNSVAFSDDGMQLVSASRDKTIKVWDRATGQCLQMLAGHNDSITSVVFSGDSMQLASASYNKTIKVWDKATGQCLQTLAGHSDIITSVVFSCDSTQLASASEDKTIKVWDRDTGQCLQTLTGHSAEVDSVAFSGDGMQLASASYDNTIKVWDRDTGQCLQTLAGHSGGVTSVAFSDDSMQLASASRDKTIKVWDRATGQCLQTLAGHSDIITSVVFSCDSTQLASASEDKTIKVWDSTTGQCLWTLVGHSTEVTSVVFSGDGMQLASVSWENTVKVWDSTTGQCLWTLAGHSNSVNSVAFSGDGTQLVSASRDKTIKVWDRATGQCLQTLAGHSAEVNSVAFSGDGMQLASASDDKTIKVWDRDTGQCLQTLTGHSAEVNSVAFSGDGMQLASASYDKTVKVWDRATGQCLRTLDVGRALSDISFSRTGFQLSTTIGIIDLERTPTTSTTTSILLTDETEIPCFRGYAISTNNVWITRNSTNLVWLPLEYRPTRSAVAGSTVAIGCASGRVLVFRFAEDEQVA